jgi:hypothetical protein
LKFRALFFAVFIFFGSLLPNSDLHELSKISTLLQHFQVHQEKYPEQAGFLQFLQMHYQDVQHMQSENHDNLPFKHFGNSPYDYFVNTPVIQSPASVAVLKPQVVYILFDPAKPESFSGSIWQPPQII